MIIFDQRIIEAVHELHKRFDGKITFAGSFGLRFNGLLERPVKDLDVFTEVNYYGDGLFKTEFNGDSSGRFMVNGQEVFCTHGSTSNGVKVDYMWKSTPLEYDITDFHGVMIKIEKPEHAIKAKREYSQFNSQSFLNRKKHDDDLNFIDGRNADDDLPF